VGLLTQGIELSRALADTWRRPSDVSMARPPPAVDRQSGQVVVLMSVVWEGIGSETAGAPDFGAHAHRSSRSAVQV
jgi:hypothetical protein